MSKLRFKFINGTEVLIDDKLEFEVVDNWYVFQQEKQIFKFFIGDSPIFVKETDCDLFRISLGKNPKCSYTLKEFGKCFDIDLEEYDYEFQDGKFVLKYGIESDREDGKCIVKTIILNFE